MDNIARDIKIAQIWCTILSWYTQHTTRQICYWIQSGMIQEIAKDDGCRTCTSNELWTTNYLIDHLKQHLATYTEVITNNEGETALVRPYCDQAFQLLKIGAYKPAPPYVIKFSHLTTRLQNELNQLDNIDRVYVLKQAVSTIFEDINVGIYHDSVSRVLRVVLQR